MITVQRQKISGECFLGGYLLELGWVLAQLLQRFMFLRYIIPLINLYSLPHSGIKTKISCSVCIALSYPLLFCAGIASLCKRNFWEFYSDFIVSRSSGIPIYGTSSQGNSGVVSNIGGNIIKDYKKIRFIRR